MLERQVESAAVPLAWRFPEEMVKKYCRLNVEHLHRWWSEVGHSAFQSQKPVVWVQAHICVLIFLQV